MSIRSPGEQAQRVTLATELARRQTGRTLYVAGYVWQTSRLPFREQQTGRLPHA